MNVLLGFLIDAVCTNCHARCIVCDCIVTYNNTFTRHYLGLLHYMGS